MDNSVHALLSLEEQERLTRLQEELEGQELTVLLERLQRQYGLSVNQMADASGMDESALHKILKGENREFKVEHVDALLDELERLHKFANTYERAVWQRALRVSAFLHYGLYKAVEPRLRQITEPGKRLDALKAYLREQYPALAETYDKSGGTFPIFVPLIDIAARELNKRWGWIRVPPGYQLNRVEGDHYYLISTDFFPKKITDLGPELEVKDTGFGTYTVRRRVVQSQPVQTISRQPQRAEPNVRFLGGFEFVRIPQGKFLMGSTYDNKLAWDDEKPQHTVEIPYDYWMAKYPVTNDQFAAFVKARNYRTTAEKDNSEYVWWRPHGHDSTLWGKGDHPVVQVSWHDAVAYCQWLNDVLHGEIKDLTVRLPTEAEWEKAARGDAKRGNEWPWGNEFDKNKCNSREGGNNDTTPVGAYSPQGDSPYGVADLAGNVWEWCHSLYKPYLHNAEKDHEDESDTRWRVVRGGAFNNRDTSVCCAARYGVNPDILTNFLGFRVVVSPGLG